MKYIFAGLVIIVWIVADFLQLFLFSKFSGKRLTKKLIFSAIIAGMLLSLFEEEIFFGPLQHLNFLQEIIYFLVVSFFIERDWRWSVRLFYVTFSLVVTDILKRSITFFILPHFGLSVALINEYRVTLDLVKICACLLALGMLNLFQYDFSRLGKRDLSQKHLKIMKMVNFSMIVYYMIAKILTVLKFSYQIETLPYRQSVVVIYLVIFMVTINVFDRLYREEIQAELDRQKQRDYQNLQRYNQQIERLYKTVRSFRHDYRNLLTTLNLAIESDDMPAVREVYQSVLKDSDSALNKKSFDLGRLVNLKDDAVKSLIAAKFVQAQEQGVDVSIDVYEEMAMTGMQMPDFITVVSILCDNAIEAAIEATPKVSIGYMTSEDGQGQILIIENSIKTPSVDTRRIYDAGYSSKGDGRGIGLANVMDILANYPNVNLKTTSKDYRFRQLLEIRDK